MYSTDNKEHLFASLSTEARELNELLLNVDWKNINFDDEYFNNGLSAQDDKLSKEQVKLVSVLVKVVPEWERLLGCQQHYIHDYCLDIHTLSVIKKLKELEEYKNLYNFEKLVVLYSALLHDISKNKNEIDPEHPLKGAKKSSSILFRLGFSKDFINSVYLLIKHHQFLGLLAAGKVKLNKEQVRKIFKTSLLVDLQKILSIADIKSVKKFEGFYDKSLDDKFDRIADEIKEMLI